VAWRPFYHKPKLIKGKMGTKIPIGAFGCL
jgi:hypothetical protein